MLLNVIVASSLTPQFTYMHYKINKIKFNDTVPRLTVVPLI